MTTEITIGLETAQRIFDALTSSMDFGSGFLESDDVEALRALAVAIGVDPAKGTPHEFAAQYPHAFVGETDRQRIAWMFGALSQNVAYSVTGAPYTVNTMDEAKLPDFTPCKIGPAGRWCGKPEADPIHEAARLAAEEPGADFDDSVCPGFTCTHPSHLAAEEPA